MRIILLSLLLGAGLSVLSRTVIREVHLVKEPKTWYEAKDFCRQKFTDLVTIESHTQNNQVQSITGDSGSVAWIGMYDKLKLWRWSLRNEQFSSDRNFNRLKYTAFRTSHLLTVSITVNGTWIPQIWAKKLPFVCYNGRGPDKYILVENAMTWHNARNVCKTTYTDLVTVRNSSENKLISQLVSSDSWIGLHRDSWVWSARTRSTFTNWDLDIPFDSSTQHKCILVNTTTGKWFEGTCKDQYDFICQHVFIKPPPKTSKTTMSFKFQSEIDLNDPTIQDQVLEQLHTKLKKHGLPDMKLHWVQTEKQHIDESTETETKKKKIELGPCG